MFFNLISPVHMSATGDPFQLMDWLSACHYRFVISLWKSLEAPVPLSTVQSTESFCTKSPYGATCRWMEVPRPKTNTSNVLNFNGNTRFLRGNDKRMWPLFMWSQTAGSEECPRFQLITSQNKEFKCHAPLLCWQQLLNRKKERKKKKNES